MTSRRRIPEGQLVLPGLEDAGVGGLKLLHVTVAEFPVAVELRRRPELRGQPIVVAVPGLSDGRGRVLSVSPEAQRLGLKRGATLAAARRFGVVVLPLDRTACRAAAREVAGVLRSVPGHWASEGWGEATLVAVTDDPNDLAAAILRRVFAATGMACAIGIGDNALKARVAARLAAPCGVVELDSAHWRERVGPLRPDVLTDIGPRRRQRLAELGVERVHDLAAADEHALVVAFEPLTRTATAPCRARRRQLPAPPGREATSELVAPVLFAHFVIGVIESECVHSMEGDATAASSDAQVGHGR